MGSGWVKVEDKMLNWPCAVFVANRRELHEVEVPDWTPDRPWDWDDPEMVEKWVQAIMAWKHHPLAGGILLGYGHHFSHMQIAFEYAHRRLPRVAPMNRLPRWLLLHFCGGCGRMVDADSQYENYLYPAPAESKYNVLQGVVCVKCSELGQFKPPSIPAASVTVREGTPTFGEKFGGSKESYTEQQLKNMTPEQRQENLKKLNEFFKTQAKLVAESSVKVEYDADVPVIRVEKPKE